MSEKLKYTPKSYVTLRQFHFLKQITNLDFEGYFHLWETDRFVLTFTRRCNNKNFKYHNLLKNVWKDATRTKTKIQIIGTNREGSHNGRKQLLTMQNFVILVLNVLSSFAVLNCFKWNTIKISSYFISLHCFNISMTVIFVKYTQCEKC